MSTNQSARFLAYTLSVICAFILASCSASATSEPTAPSQPTTAPTQTASPNPTDTLEPTVTNTTEPTETPVPTETATPTPEPVAFTVEKLLIEQAPWQSDPDYEACGVGPISFFCPKDWFAMEAERQVAYVSNEALLEGFGNGKQGGQLQISAFSVFDIYAAAPEDALQSLLNNVFPDDAAREIIDGPITFSLNDQDAAALTLQYDAQDPTLVALLIAIQQSGHIITIVANTTADMAEQLLPVMAKGLTALEVDLEARSHYLLPAGSTSGTMSTLDGASPGSIPIYTNSYETVFIAVDPVPAEVDVQLELIDPYTNQVLASSDRDGKEYIIYTFEQAGEYELVIHSDQPGSYFTWLITSPGVSAAAYAGSNQFSSRLPADSALSYVLMINSGEVADITVTPDQAALDLVATVYSATDGTPLLVADDAGAGDTETFTFVPPLDDLYVLVIEAKDASSGTYTLLVEYR